jgi:hypothetical protein
LCCTFNNAQGTQSGLEILGNEGSVLLRDGTVTFKPETEHEDNRWIVDSWTEALEKAYYDDPKVQASESPGMAAGHVAPAGETWHTEGRDSSFMHIQNFFDCVRSRKKPYEDALFGHRAAACAHMVNQSIRMKRLIEWNFAEEKTL